MADTRRMKNFQENREQLRRRSLCHNSMGRRSTGSRHAPARLTTVSQRKEVPPRVQGGSRHAKSHSAGRQQATRFLVFHCQVDHFGADRCSLVDLRPLRRTQGASSRATWWVARRCPAARRRASCLRAGSRPDVLCPRRHCRMIRHQVKLCYATRCPTVVALYRLRVTLFGRSLRSPIALLRPLTQETTRLARRRPPPWHPAVSCQRLGSWLRAHRRQAQSLARRHMADHGHHPRQRGRRRCAKHPILTRRRHQRL